MKTKLIQTKDYLLLIDEEAEIKPDDYIIHDTVEGVIEANGEWHYRGEKDDYWNKVIAYYPLTKEAKELDLPELPPFEVDIEIMWSDFNKNHNRNCPLGKEQFVRAINYKAAQSKQFSLEDMRNMFILGGKHKMQNPDSFLIKMEEILESLSTQQLPKEFIPEYEYYYHSSKEFYADAGFIKCSKEQYKSIKEEIPTCPVKVELKTITNSEGRSEVVGTYKY